MTFSIYKPGQGYWTRVLTAAGAGAFVLAGVAWVWSHLSTLADAYRLYAQAASAVALLASFSLLLWWLLNKPRIVDFMIATEAEMRKVNWPSRREVTGSTWIVICGTFMMAFMLFFVDIAFTILFTEIHILDSGIDLVSKILGSGT